MELIENSRRKRTSEMLMRRKATGVKCEVRKKWKTTQKAGGNTKSDHLRQHAHRPAQLGRSNHNTRLKRLSDYFGKACIV
eukprot:6171932-Pleurochrysis_carterae.AAC.2